MERTERTDPLDLLESADIDLVPTENTRDASMLEFLLVPLLIEGDPPAAREDEVNGDPVRAAGDEPLLAAGVVPPCRLEITVEFPVATLVLLVPFVVEEVARRDATDRDRRGFFTRSL